MDQPGKVANPARGQLNRENNIPLSPCVPENFGLVYGIVSSMYMPPYIHNTSTSQGENAPGSARRFVGNRRDAIPK